MPRCPVKKSPKGGTPDVNKSRESFATKTRAKLKKDADDKGGGAVGEESGCEASGQRR